jgi:hypothetical protein
MPFTLVASAVIGLMALAGVFVSNFSSREAAMTLDPTELAAVPGEAFTVSVLVSSAIPVNAFTGMVTFDHTVLSIEKIDYNTSIADLWTEEPWFSQGDGTINFTGGTTHPGGFTGTGALVVITFKATAPGDAKLVLQNARILQHDGLGTDVSLATPIDTAFTVTPASLTTITSRNSTSEITVTPPVIPTDLNQDGKTTLADISIFMLYLATGDTRGDITRDGHINTTDLSILLDARSH